jgi:hypothetical protein
LRDSGLNRFVHRPVKGNNYFNVSFQQLTQTLAKAHAIFIMGALMSIRHGAWVFGAALFDN